MAMTLRGGATVQLNAADLVRGDVVVLNTGDKVSTMLNVFMYSADV
jgi:magnesium-transporting ATPase (P-type)